MHRLTIALTAGIWVVAAGCGSGKSDASSDDTGVPSTGLTGADAGEDDGTTEDPSTDADTGTPEDTGDPSAGDDDAGDTAGDDAGFVDVDMAVGGCGTMCDPFAQDCAEGEKCMPVVCETGTLAWDSNACRPIMGDKQAGDACNPMGSDLDGVDDCGAGLMCIIDDGDDLFAGHCWALCEGTLNSPICADTTATCAVNNNGVLPLCKPACDPLSIDCPGNQLCTPDGADGFGCTWNISQDMHPYGAPCQYTNQCNVGLLCWDAATVPAAECQDSGSNGCCTPVCDTDEPNTCPGEGQACVAYFDGSSPPGLESVGICVIPS